MIKFGKLNLNWDKNMKIKRRSKMNFGLIMRDIIFIIIGIMLSNNLMAQDGAALYKPCGACHTIGKGKSVGPDLKGISKRRTNEWLLKFIKAPLEMQQSGDAQAVAIFKEYNNVPMPPNQLTPDQINKILVYIDGAGANAIDPAKEALMRKIDTMLKKNAPMDIEKGKALFIGKKHFRNGGPSCIVCHNAGYDVSFGGGNLAKDLTKAYARLNGFTGIKGVLEIPPFASMADSYKISPLTELEIAYLQLYLKSTNSKYGKNPIFEIMILLRNGIVGVVILTFLIALIWNKRKKQSVNHEILKRQIRYSK